MNIKKDNIYNDSDYIQYQKEYFRNSKFTEIVFKGLDDFDNKINFNITIQEDKNEKILNFYNNPIDLDNIGLSLSSYNNIIHEIKKIISEQNIKSIAFKKEINEKILEELLKKNKNNIDFLGIESTINLNKDLHSIQKNFSKGHRSALKIDYKNLKYELFDFKNYQKEQIFEMMNLHEKVSGKKTRSNETWKINENMIISKKGFLIKVSDNTRLISYAFIFFNKNNAIYFSSCTLRDTFKLYKNITHKIIWESIKYLKDIGCEKFFLGNTKSIYSKNEVDKKNKNIDLFKSSFGGDPSIFVIYNNISDF